MSYSTTQIECRHCKEKYSAAIEGEFFKIDNEYAATCPNCDNETFIKNATGIVVDSKPAGLANIYRVVQINK